MSKENTKKVKDRRELRPIIISAKKQKQTFILGHNEIYTINETKVNFTAPNNISICLNIAEREFSIARDMFHSLIHPKLKGKPKKASFENEESSKLFDYFEHLQISLIFAYIAVEAFSNIAIPNDFVFEKMNSKKVKEIWSKENIERYLSTSEKLNDILPKIFKIESPIKETFWNEFKKLEEIRNEIIHQKTVTNEVNVSSKYLHEFFSIKIFDIIRSGFLILEYFCSKVEFAHVYFPLGLGTNKQKAEEIDDFENYFAIVEDNEK